MSAKVRSLSIFDVLKAQAAGTPPPDIDFEPEKAFATEHAGKLVSFTAPNGDTVQGRVIGYAEEFPSGLELKPSLLLGVDIEVFMAGTPGDAVPISTDKVRDIALGMMNREFMLADEGGYLLQFTHGKTLENEVVIYHDLDRVTLV